ncbi:MAG: TRAP transporter large permease [Rhodospirillales bacterium]|nr:TRAP transporter large permease [Acidobacteriota bacterium]MDH3791890.1 TRAP transporter large permease [Rhodospirillales bacterium]MDH3911913.1 TRAP transporter large permease [Rhodospirillales bacterium]MDH3969016.1 TRAP transporter large permease [Rhodospirillales bacterium]
MSVGAAIAIAFVICLLLGVPIATAMGIAAVVAILIAGLPITFLVQVMFEALNSFPLIAIPLFILAGAIMERGGLSQRIVDIFMPLIGRSYGGLAIVTILACMFFAAISGSGPPTVAAIGSIMIPSMLRQGYTASFSGGVTASGGTLGILIPPSVPMIIYGVSSETSIPRLFAAGIVPGVAVGLMLTVTAYLLARRAGYRSADAAVDVIAFLRALRRGIWALLAPIIILGGIYTSVFTPTESAVVAVVYGLLVSLLVYREMTFAKLKETFIFSATISGSVLVIIATATVFGQILTLQNIPQDMAKWIASLSDDKHVILLIVCVLLIFIGMWMDTIAQIILLTPVLLPVVKTMGVDPVHFGILFVLCCEIGFLTPPLGVNLFVAMRLTGCSIESLSKSALPYVMVLVFAIIVMIFLPEITLWMPSLLYDR